MLENFSFDWYRNRGRVSERGLTLRLVQRTGALQRDEYGNATLASDADLTSDNRVLTAADIIAHHNLCSMGLGLEIM